MVLWTGDVPWAYSKPSNIGYFFVTTQSRLPGGVLELPPRSHRIFTSCLFLDQALSDTSTACNGAWGTQSFGAGFSYSVACGPLLLWLKFRIGLHACLRPGQFFLSVSLMSASSLQTTSRYTWSLQRVSNVK